MKRFALAFVGCYQATKNSLPAAEFVGVFLTSHVKVEAQVGINAYAEVVVHDEDGRGVLVGVGRVTLVLNRDPGLVDLLVVRVKDHSPSASK